ncbi:MAG: glycosidase [Myxococcota bacterium]|jgi:glycosidase
MSRPALIVLLASAGCCRNTIAPVLNDPADRAMDEDTTITWDLTELVVDSTLPEDELIFSVEVSDPDNVDLSLDGTTLSLTPLDGFEGVIDVTVTALDACETTGAVTFDLTIGDGIITTDSDAPCATGFTTTPQSDPAAVFLAGDFNDWDASVTPLTDNGDGTWSVFLELEAGSYTYKFVEDDGGGGQAWNCDEDALRQCDEGYEWQRECTLGVESCNSLVVVADCALPTLDVTGLTIDRDAGSVAATIDFATGGSGAALASASVTLDGAPVSASWDGTSPLSLSLTDLTATRHTLRITATDADGNEADPLYIPFWLDDRDWASGMMYFAFVDRFANGDTSNDNPYGTNIETGEYLGGDWQGLIDRLDDLDDLGVTVLWLTAPWDNPAGTFDADCGATITGYHGYWPSSATNLEEHFGTEDTLATLIDEAHARNMRVLVDWVGNHVHDDHPWVAEHPEWFTTPALCTADDNWNDIPETCWFATYLPTIRYYEIEPLVESVEIAIDFAQEYGIDGFRVDAVKHIPHSVHYNMQALIRDRIEHTDAGGDEDFYTVGETFSGDRDLIMSYVWDGELDGQFDFATYWSILSALARDESALYSLEDTFDASAEAFGDATMSIFLGNHDVERFISHAAGEVGSLYGDGFCPDGSWRGPASSPDFDEPYYRLKLAWTWLLTHSGLPLVYYGDEIGLPGYHDPDNRQMMRFDGELSSRESDVRDHLATLAAARQDHPALYDGEKVVWWRGDDGSPDQLAWARSGEHGESLVMINRSWGEYTMTNGLSWAGLTPGTTYTDVLTGQTWSASGDSLTVTIPAWGSVVLVSD